MSARRGFAQIIVVAIVALVIGSSAMFAYQKYTQRPAPSPTPILSASPRPSPTPILSASPRTQINKSSSSPSPDEMVGWKTYETDKFSISYPPHWILENFPDSDVTFKSKDFFVDHHYVDSVPTGFSVSLFIGKDKVPTELAVIYSEETTWLGKKATLHLNGLEGVMAELWTNEKSPDLFMGIGLPSNEEVALKTFKDNKKDFLSFANSLKLK